MRVVLLCPDARRRRALSLRLAALGHPPTEASSEASAVWAIEMVDAEMVVTTIRLGARDLAPPEVRIVYVGPGDDLDVALAVS